MIPKALINTELKLAEDIETSITYNVSDDKIQGYIDGLEALKQAIYKVINTERYEYPIYSFSYGIELESLMGKDSVYVKVELKRRIQECLLQDERIKRVEDFEFTATNDEIFCTFKVVSVFGNLLISKGVNT